MAHEHHSDHAVHGEATGVGLGMGFIVALGTIVLVAILALAILFAVQPWDDDGTVSETPITDDSGGGSGGGTGNGDAPAQ